jgi:hypothetical protein
MRFCNLPSLLFRSGGLRAPRWSHRRRVNQGPVTIQLLGDGQGLELTIAGADSGVPFGNGNDSGAASHYHRGACGGHSLPCRMTKARTGWYVSGRPGRGTGQGHGQPRRSKRPWPGRVRRERLQR